MNKQIVRVAPFQNAKVFAVMYLIMGIPLGALFVLAPSANGQAMPWWMLLVMPLVYMLFGFIFSLVGAWIFNFVAGKVGGFEYTTIDVTQND